MNSQFYSPISSSDSVVYEGIDGISYFWNGTVSGDFETATNYTPNGIPTSIDNVLIDETSTNMPDSGTLTCNLLTLSNTDPMSYNVQINNGASVVCTNAILGNGCANIGDITTATFNTGSNNSGSVDNATFNGSSANNGSLTNGTFNDSSNNYSEINGIGYFNDTSGNYGTVAQAEFTPTFVDSAWVYPTNSGTGTIANCYWLEVDHALEAGFVTVNYLGYIV